MTEPKSDCHKGSLTLWALVAWLLKEELGKKDEDENNKRKNHVPHQGHSSSMSRMPDTLYLQYPVYVEYDQDKTDNYCSETNPQNFILWLYH